MRKLVLALVAGLMASQVIALTPDDVRNMYPVAVAAPCRDTVTGTDGTCFVFIRPDGLYYMVFVKDGEPVFMRQTLPDGTYIEVWRAGIAL